MSRLRLNLVASFAGRGWSSLLQLALVPIYLHLLGVAAYALVGFYTVLYSVVIRLDMGLSTTLNRELAVGSASRDADERRRLTSLVRTLEFVYVSLAIVVGAAIALGAPLLSRYWLNHSSLDETTVRRAVTMMGLLVAVQWPVSLYEGGLRGLERQVLLNTINIVAATVRGLGAVLVLLLVSRTIIAYFVWQSIATGFQVAALAIAVWRSLPDSASRPRFVWAELRRVARFTAGISGISLLSLALTQSDKLVLSHLLPLDRFGYYMVASSVAGGLLIVATPLFEAIFPRFSALYSEGNTMALKRTYHAAMQLSSILVLPLGLTLVAFSDNIALLWLRDPVAVAHTHTLIALLAVGTTANVLMTIPFALQLASGWTALSFYKNVIALAFAIPFLIFAVRRWGEIGAALTWIIVNVGYLAFELPYMHRRLLRGALRSVYLVDVGPSLLAVGIALWGVKVLMKSLGAGAGPTVTVGALGSAAAVALASPLARAQLRALLQARRQRAIAAGSP